MDDRTPPRGAIPDAAKIMLVQDNLNTHKPASLYEAFPAAEARRLVERFEWHYTSKHCSWLDMAALVGKRVNLRSAPSSAIIRTSESSFRRPHA